MKFTELDLHPSVMSSLDALKFTDCTPVQEAAIPHILAGKDLAGLAQTGTGKTAAYVLPLMDRILNSVEPEGSVPEGRAKRAFNQWKRTNYILVLVPTRELAEQVQQNVKDLGQHTQLRVVSVYGGTSYEPQKKALSEGVQFVVATPGRLIDLFKEHVVDLSQVRAVVFDEADRMFDMGFKDDMKYILKRLPRDRQFLVFSATLNFDVLNVAYEFGAEPVEINVSRDQAKAENVDDELFHVGAQEKASYLLSLVKKLGPKQAIIFSNFKNNVERLTDFLNANAVPAVGISSLLSQAQRNRVMEQFKADNDRNILVATDVAARGLDIKGVDLVINFELPDDPENYVHRIGRTGRAGARGKAVSLVSDRDVDALARIEDYLGHKVKTGWLEDGEIIKDHKPFDDGRGDRHRKPRRDGEGRRDRGERQGRPDRGGDRPQGQGRGDRRGRRGGRGRDRDRNPQPGQAARGEGRAPNAAPGEGVHRDRLTGRHGGSHQPGADGAQQPRRHEGRPNGQGGGRHRDQRRDRHRDRNAHKGAGGPNAQGQRPYRGGRYRVDEKPKAQSKSIGEKISGFIKGLFGR